MSTMIKRFTAMLLCCCLIASGTAQSETYFYHNDHLGTPQVLTDENQQVVWKAEYDPFGKATETVNEVEQNLRFPGQYYDRETGLHYNYHRTYDPSTGRYLESDPTGLIGGLSTYGYAYQSPVGYIDPYGDIPLVIPVLSFAGKATAGIAAWFALEVGLASLEGPAPAGADQLAQTTLPDLGLGIALHAGTKALRACRAYFSRPSVAAKGIAKVPGRVQSRINLSNKGVNHVLNTHLNPARAANKSQFTLSQSELRSLLGSKSTVQAQARALETSNFARTITTNRTVGNLADKMGGGPTNTFTVITDKFGNLQSAFPGGL